MCCAVGNLLCMLSGLLSGISSAAQNLYIDAGGTVRCAQQVSEGLDVVAAIDEAFVDDSGRPLQVPAVICPHLSTRVVQHITLV